jgi:hypothetical protein
MTLASCIQYQQQKGGKELNTMLQHLLKGQGHGSDIRKLHISSRKGGREINRIERILINQRDHSIERVD